MTLLNTMQGYARGRRRPISAQQGYGPPTAGSVVDRMLRYLGIAPANLDPGTRTTLNRAYASGGTQGFQRAFSGMGQDQQTYTDARSRANRSSDLQDMLTQAQIAQIMGGGGGGGGAGRTQFASERGLDEAQIANLSAQTGLLRPGFDLQAELGRGNLDVAQRQLQLDTGLGMYNAQTGRLEQGTHQYGAETERAGQLATAGANPRRIFEAVLMQNRLNPTRTSRALQNVVSMAYGGGVRPRPNRGSGSTRKMLERALQYRRVGYAAQGKTVDGPAMLVVGDGPAGQTKEAVLAAPGTIVAPLHGKDPTMANAIAAVLKQVHGMKDGGAVSPGKAKKILSDGSVRGHDLTAKQKKFFGWLAGGGKKPRRAADGLAIERARASGRKRPVKAAEGLAVEAYRRRASLTRMAGNLGRGVTLADMARTADLYGRSRKPKSAAGGVNVDTLRNLFMDTGFGTGGLFGERPNRNVGEGFGAGGRGVGAIAQDLRSGRGTTRGAPSTSLYDPLGGGSFNASQRATLTGMNARQLSRLSPTQQQFTEALLSAGGVEPVDYFTEKQRELEGFNPVRVGTRARYAGAL